MSLRYYPKPTSIRIINTSQSNFFRITVTTVFFGIFTKTVTDVMKVDIHLFCKICIPNATTFNKNKNIKEVFVMTIITSQLKKKQVTPS